MVRLGENAVSPVLTAQLSRARFLLSADRRDRQLPDERAKYEHGSPMVVAGDDLFQLMFIARDQGASPSSLGKK